MRMGYISLKNEGMRMNLNLFTDSSMAPSTRLNVHALPCFCLLLVSNLTIDRVNGICIPYERLPRIREALHRTSKAYGTLAPAARFFTNAPGAGAIQQSPVHCSSHQVTQLLQYYIPRSSDSAFRKCYSSSRKLGIRFSSITQCAQIDYMHVAIAEACALSKL